MVLAWGPWGFLLLKHETGTNRIVLVDNTGEPVWSRPAHWAYASPNGDALISFYNNEIREFQHVDLDSDPTDVGEWFELPSLGVTSIGWSPDGEQLAIVSLGRTAKAQLDTYDIGGTLVDQVPLDWHVWDVHWSQDGRFLVMPAVRDGAYAVLFYDIEAKQLTPVEFDEAIRVAVMAS
jgi:WD40 repeat protein